MSARPLPHGVWPSAVQPHLLAEAVRLNECAWSRDGRHLVWHEEVSGAGVLLASAAEGDAPFTLTAGRAVRARVGYGGGHFAAGGRVVVYVADDGRLYRQALEGGPGHPITPPGVRCAAPALSPDDAWVVYVYEIGEESGLALVPGDGSRWPQRVAHGHDFYMQPAWRPDGQALAWVCWDHPRMPWDGALLCTMAVAPGAGGWHTEAPRVLAGGERESVLQPQFAPDGRGLAYLSDRDGWYRLYRCDPDAPDTGHACLTPDEAEHGGPAWQQGMRWFDWLPGGRGLVAQRIRDATASLVRVDAAGGGEAPYPAGRCAYSDFQRPAVNPADGRVACFAAGERVPPRLVVFPAPSERPHAPARIVRRGGWEQLAPEALAPLEPITWPAEDGGTVHGLFAPPTHPTAHGEGAPPLVVSIHGGPTAQAMRTWRLDAQFFTSRGYAYLDVNHRGSSGYGRAYRERLREGWGVVDVSDAVAGVRHLAAAGRADGSRCAIRGSSAGGYTALRALTVHPEVFRAGICLYGIGDLLALARETHKFEAHYLDTLVGPLPRQAERYRERSPLFQAGRITAALLVCQGGEDRVVPPAQSEAIVASLRARGVPCEYLLFPEEGHGFRRRETLLAVWQAIERFLRTHLVYA